MRKILLFGGKFALVDDEDYEFLNQWKWYQHFSGMVVRNEPLDVVIDRMHRQSVVFMHRVIMNTPKGMDTDHIDGNRQNNQKGNLRVCSHSENMRNRKLNKNSTSGYKGVHWSSKYRTWIARIQVNGSRLYLGKFHNLEDAARIYDKEAKKHHGAFAKLNFE